MSDLSRLRALWRNLIHRRRVERELYEELSALEIGQIDAIAADVRQTRGGAVLEQLLRDSAYALRMLRKHAGLTVIAVVTLALGAGANTAVFSVADTMLFRPLPYEHPERVVKICGMSLRDHACDDDFSFAELDAIRRSTGVFQQVAADDGMTVTVMHADGSREPLGVGLISANWLATLGVRPIVGRDFTPDEQQPGRDRVVLLTDDYWRRRFGGDAAAVGKTLVFDGAAHTVIGVLPPNVLRSYADVLKPLVVATDSDGSLDLFGRLAAGTSVAQAQAALDVVGPRVETERAASDPGRRLTIEPLGRYYAPVKSGSARGLMLVLGAVALVLLIACANVASLLLASVGVRRRECLVRSALGASRARLVRQLLIEHALLYLIGGGLGLVLAKLSLDSLTALAVSGGYVPARMVVTMDLRVLGVSLAISLVTGVAFGLVPALQASNVNLTEGLRASAPTHTGAGRRTGRRALIVAQLALSLMLLAGFALLARSFQQVYSASAGFNAENVLITGSDGGRDFPRAVAFWRDVLARTRAIPGVESAAVTSRPPVHGARRQRFVIDGHAPVPTDETAQADDILVSADYFATLGIPLRAGRTFTDADDERSAPVAIISESVARRDFPHQNPIGQRIRLLEHSPMSCCSAAGPVESVWRDVVGVVADVRQANLDDEPARTVYRPFSQIVEHDMYLAVRTGSSAAGPVTAALRARVTATRPTNGAAADWIGVTTMARMIHESDSIRLRRFVLILLGGFALIAVLLAASGVYGVASSAVAERTREIGVRIAFGATPASILRRMVTEMIALAAAGVALGTAGTLALTRVIRTMLFGVAPSDVRTYVTVTAVLGAVVIAAACVPSRRAMRVDPLVALRHE